MLDDLQTTGINGLLEPLFPDIQVFLQIYTTKLLTQLIQDSLLPEAKHKMKLKPSPFSEGEEMTFSGVLRMENHLHPTILRKPN